MWLTMNNSNKNLFQRALTALILAPLVIWGILSLPPVSFGIFSALVLLLAAVEWPRLLGLKPLFHTMMFLVLMILSFGLSFIVTHVSLDTQLSKLIYFSVIFAFWVFMVANILYFQRHQCLMLKSFSVHYLTGLLVIAPCWLGLNLLRDLQSGRWLVLLLVFTVWTADIFAYFAGKHWGKKKLLVNVSPGKTWVGAIAAVISGLLISVLIGLLSPVAEQLRLGLMVLLPVCVIFSIVGDLAMSAYKRHFGIKDTGQLLPGHGGLLDRLDSLFAATPIFVLGLLLLGA